MIRGDREYTQPDLLRLLAILCLEKSLYKRSSWADEDAPDAQLCELMIHFTRNISVLSEKNRLREISEYVSRLHGGKSSVNLEWDDGSQSLRVGHNGPEITSSHIKGEAYELLCAIIFKCKGETPLLLRNYYAPEDEIVERDCRVTRVFLSEGLGLQDTLKWQDGDMEWETYVQNNILEYLRGRGASDEVVEKIGIELSRNVTQDLGFDIFVELQEEHTPTNRHFLLAQCKYRSNEYIDVGMSGYVGKYYNIVHLFDRVHEQLRSQNTANYVPTLLPFFWMSTEISPDSMEYFTHLRDAGRVRLYGNAAMTTDEGICNLITNIRLHTQKWLGRIRNPTGTAGEIQFQYEPAKPKILRDYQTAAVDSVLAYYKDDGEQTEKNEHSSIIMATGSGKTLTSLECVLKIETDEGIDMRKRVRDENIAASLHFSPMIRLVLQNAHVWLSEELARHTEEHGVSQEKFKMIYYCICSLKKERNSAAFSGCTAVRLIDTSKVYSVFEHHKAQGDIHYCRFFTTYQAGKALRNILRKINLQQYQKKVNHQLFGISVRDEAHAAAGRGGKVHSASLYIAAHISLNFTASPKYDFDHLKMIYPYTYSSENLGNQGVHTYYSLANEAIFPQVDYEVAKAMMTEMDNEYTDGEYRLDPTDLLSEDFLFYIHESGQTYDWAYFQKHCLAGALVFYVDGSKVVYTDSDHHTYFDVCLDDNGDPKYFGVSGSEQTEKINRNTECYGVDETLSILYLPHDGSRGFQMHDMTGLGKHNKIGPVIYKLGYLELFEQKRLAAPKLIMLARRQVSQEEYEKFNIQGTTYLDAIFGEYMTEKGKKTKQPDKVKWKLTIAKNIVESTAHAFRAMKLLFDCFFEEKENPIKTALVFCSKTEQSKECSAIFTALLEKGVETRKLEQEQMDDFFSGIIYTSDRSAQDDEELMMSYDAQQHKIASFCAASMGVLFNVKLIGIGVDLPDVDAALIVNPGDSVSDITQRIGRTLRTGSNENKIAKVLVPAWDASDMIDPPEVSAQVSPAVAMSVDNEPPSTPSARPSSSRQSASVTPNVTSNHSWQPPVHEAFENRFFLQLKVLEAMNNEKTPMLSSFFGGVGKTDSRNQFDDVRAKTGNQLIADLKGGIQGDPFIPTFDESFSEFLLSVWGSKVVDIGGEMRAAREPLPKDYYENKNLSKAFMLVVLTACCHHRSYLGQIEVDPNHNTPIWYKTCTPFKDNERMEMNNLRTITDESYWKLFDFSSADEFEKAVKNLNNNHMSMDVMKTKFYKLEESARNEIMETFLSRLEEDIRKEEELYVTFMDKVCESMNRHCKRDDCGHDNHKICDGFGFTSFEEFRNLFQTFLGDENLWMKHMTKSAMQKAPSLMTESRCTKRKSQELDDSDDDDVMSPEKLDIDLNIPILFAARPSTSSVPRRSSGGDNVSRNLDNALQDAQ